MNYDKQTLIDLFAGAGGLSLGALRAGFSLGGVVDLDNKAVITHEKNFPKIKHLSCDLGECSGFDLLKRLELTNNEVVGVVGGPPCQGFSNMGHRNPDDVRNNLFVRFFQIVSEIKPLFFLAENVPGILNSKFSEIRNSAFKLVIDDYDMLDPVAIKASDLGAPTIRKRVFFIGTRKDSNLRISENDFLSLIENSETVTVREALKGLPNSLNEVDDQGRVTLKADYSINKELNTGSEFHRRVVGYIPEGSGNPCTVRSYNENRVVTGMNRTTHKDFIVERYANIPIGKSDPISKSVKLDPNSFCPTLRAGTGPEKGSYQAVRPIHYSEARVITPREAARLQGFPDWFEFDTTIWHSFRQIGNSVSPIVAEKVLRVIYQKLTEWKCG